MKDVTAAKDLADLVQTGLAGVRMQLRRSSELSSVPGAIEALDALQVRTEGTRVTLSATGAGGGASIAGIVAAVAVPSLLRARVSANESSVIGDTRTVISAQAAYQTANAGWYGEMLCLGQPKLCIVGYSGPQLLDAELASLREKSGYRRAFHPGPAASTARSLSAYAYTASPVRQGETGVRSFCGDATGLVCFDPTGADIVPENGACPSTCVPLQ
jgi:type II secretory pathway pseudopilin PulG